MTLVKILIAGNGKVGETLASELSGEGYELTLIDNNSHTLEGTLGRLDVMTVEGNCAALPTLTAAGVENADLLIAATGSDEVNLLCCMTAHKLNPRLHTIARIRNPEYTDQAYAMRDEFALSMIFNPEQQTAIEIERLLKFPAFLKRDSFAKGRVEIVELKIEEDSKLCHVPLAEISSLVKCKILVCAVLRDGVCITPDGSFVPEAGDRIFVTAPTENLTALLKSLGIVTHRAKRVLLVGGGTISYYLAQRLLKNRIAVQILEKDEKRCLQLAELLPEADVLLGDAGERETLDSEHFADADALVALTGLDEMNVILSLWGSSRGIPATITKLGRMENTALIDALPVGSIVSPRKLCCNTIVRYVRAMQNQTGAALTIHTIADGQAEAVEFPIDATTLHCGVPLKKLKTKKNILVACIARGKDVTIPNGDSSFLVGDHVIVVISGGEILHNFNDIFED